MGFFSWCCPVCGLSITASPYENIEWQNRCVLILDEHTRHEGSYDGYGRIENDLGTVDIQEVLPGDSIKNTSLYHKACWEYAGRPMTHTPSEHAQDQGYFFDDDDHNIESPLIQKLLLDKTKDDELPLMINTRWSVKGLEEEYKRRLARSTPR